MSIRSVNLKDKHVVLKAEIFKPEFRGIRHRVAKATFGFGCNPASMGRAVFVEFVIDGETSRFNREDVERLATDEEVAEARKGVPTA